MVGELSETEADQLLRIMPAVQPIKPLLLNPEGRDAKRNRQDEDEDDHYLRRALAESRKLVEQDDTALQKALRDSMHGEAF